MPANGSRLSSPIVKVGLLVAAVVVVLFLLQSARSGDGEAAVADRLGKTGG